MIRRLFDSHLIRINQRLTVLEEKVFKQKKEFTATKAQKILILKHTGLLDKIDDLRMSQNNKALLLSVLLDLDKDNIEKDLNQVGRKDSPLEKQQNYIFLTEFFKKIKLKELSEEAETILEKIQSRGEE